MKGLADFPCEACRIGAPLLTEEEIKGFHKNDFIMAARTDRLCKAAS